MKNLITKREPDFKSTPKYFIARRLKVLHRSVVVSAWSAFSGILDDILTSWLSEHKEMMHRKIFCTQSIKVSDFINNSPCDFTKLLLANAEVREPNSKSVITYSLKRRLALLSAMDLNPDIEDIVVSQLKEFQAVRNCIIHNYSFVDEDFLRVCNSSIWKNGQEIDLGVDDLFRYFSAASACLAGIEAAVYAYLEKHARPQLGLPS